MVICPGGGYGGLVTGPEGHGIADWLGTTASPASCSSTACPPVVRWCPCSMPSARSALVRAMPATWGNRSRRIGIIGFSAGGHLASTAGTHFDAGDAAASDPIAA
jgi:hypothetical protein